MEQRRSSRPLMVGILMLAALSFLVSTAQAQDWPYRDGEVITLVVPFNPGGGFDRILRVLQPYLDAALTELSGGRSITVIVENRAGAGGRVAYEQVFSSPPDGTRFVILGDDGASLQQMALGARFDLEEFTYIGQINRSDWGIFVRSNIDVDDLNDWVRRSQEFPNLMGTSGAGSGDHIGSLLVSQILNDNLVFYNNDFVHFDSSASVLASMRRNEAEAYIGSVESIKPWTDEGVAKLIVTFSAERSLYFPDVPTVFEQGVAGAAELAAAIKLTRVLVGPPGIPEDRANVMRQALEMATSNPEFLERAAQAELPIVYANAEDARAGVVSTLAAKAVYRDVIVRAIGGN